MRVVRWGCGEVYMLNSTILTCIITASVCCNSSTAIADSDDKKPFTCIAIISAGDDVKLQKSTAAPIDAVLLFSQIVARYRDLAVYEDTVDVEQVISRDGEESTKEETEIRCEIDENGEVSVSTPAQLIAKDLGIGALFHDWMISPARSQFDTWMAPHMTLRVSKKPLSEFRSGVEEGFTPVKAEKVTVEKKELVRVDLQSGNGESEDYRAHFELFVDPETLLITHIHGEQMLPDGANLVTDYEITTERAVTSDGTTIAFPLEENTSI